MNWWNLQIAYNIKLGKGENKEWKRDKEVSISTEDRNCRKSHIVLSKHNRCLSDASSGLERK